MPDGRVYLFSCLSHLVFDLLFRVFWFGAEDGPYEWVTPLENEHFHCEYADGTNCRDPQIVHTWRNEIRVSFCLTLLLYVVIDLESVVHIGPTNAQHDNHPGHKHHINLTHLALLRTFLLLLFLGHRLFHNCLFSDVTITARLLRPCWHRFQFKKYDFYFNIL